MEDQEVIVGRDQRLNEIERAETADVNNFDVMKRMSELGQEIYFGTDIVRIQKVKAGTLIEVGIGGDFIGRIASGEVVGGVFLWSREQFRKTKAEMAAAAAAVETAEAAETAETAKDREREKADDRADNDDD